MAKDVKLSKTVPTGQNTNLPSNHNCDLCQSALSQRELQVVKTLLSNGRKRTDFYCKEYGTTFVPCKKAG